MPKVRCTEPHRKQVLRKLWAKSLSPSADYLPKMRFKDACYYEVLWKLRFVFKEIDVSEKQDSRIKRREVWSQLLEFCSATTTELGVRRIFRLTFWTVDFL